MSFIFEDSLHMRSRVMRHLFLFVHQQSFFLTFRRTKFALIKSHDLFLYNIKIYQMSSILILAMIAFAVPHLLNFICLYIWELFFSDFTIVVLMAQLLLYELWRPNIDCKVKHIIELLHYCRWSSGIFGWSFLHYEKKVLTLTVNNSININKTNIHLSSQIVKHKDDIFQ